MLIGDMILHSTTLYVARGGIEAKELVVDLDGLAVLQRVEKGGPCFEI